MVPWFRARAVRSCPAHRDLQRGAAAQLGLLEQELRPDDRERRAAGRELVDRAAHAVLEPRAFVPVVVAGQEATGLHHAKVGLEVALDALVAVVRVDVDPVEALLGEARRRLERACAANDDLSGRDLRGEALEHARVHRVELLLSVLAVPTVARVLIAGVGPVLPRVDQVQPHRAPAGEDRGGEVAPPGPHLRALGALGQQAQQAFALLLATVHAQLARDARRVQREPREAAQPTPVERHLIWHGATLCDSEHRGLDAIGALRAEPVFAVRAHVVDDRQQRPALLGERVLDARGHLGERVALDDALLLERTQAQRQRARADPRERAFELAEARAPLRQVAHEQQRPLAAHDLRGHTHRACLIDGHYALYFTN